MTDSESFKVGDAVIHKSGTGPNMVVIKVEENSGVVWCEWISPEGKRASDSYLPTSLMKPYSG